MLVRVITVGVALLMLAGGALMFFGPWLKPEAAPEKMPACPYLAADDLSSVRPEVVAAIGAYEAIRETLGRGSIEGVPAQADVIARTFFAESPEIAGCAKRLAGEPDVESARRAFLRLNRLMEKHTAAAPAS